MKVGVYILWLRGHLQIGQQAGSQANQVAASGSLLYITSLTPSARIIPD